MSDQSRAREVLDKWKALEGELSTWKSWWQELGNYVMPRKAEIDEDKTYPDGTKEARLFDSTAQQSNITLAQGQMSYVSPMEDKWFKLEPPRPLRGDKEALAWYSECSEIMLEELANSNFYTELHEGYLNRGGFGTAAIFAAESTSRLSTAALYFHSHDVGTFAIAEDDEGNVNAVYRTFEFTPNQLISKFGEENVTADVIAAKNNKKGDTEKFCVIHAVYQRDDYDPDKLDPENKPIASCYVLQKGEKLLREGGFDEWPYGVTRYLRWSSSVYGWCPTWMALPDIKGVQHLEEMLDVLAETAAFPRVLSPSGLEGEIDLRAAGITTFDPAEVNGEPKEWATQGRYDIGKDRSDVRKQAIEKAYHVDLFRMFSSLDKQMTAREVSERSSEKLIQFSPTFARMTTELFNPILKRVFGILYRRGMFPDAPESVLGDSQAPALPDTKYNSRVALAIQAIQSNALYSAMEVAQGVAQYDPDAILAIDWGKALVDFVRNGGAPEAWIRSSKDLEAIRAQIAQQREQQAQIEQAATAAKAGKDMSDMNPENLEKMQEMAQ